MPQQLMKYNPAFLSEEDLVQLFAVRQADLKLVLDTIRQNTGTNSNQHILVIGPRGIGKTTLARRVAVEIRRNADLSIHWHPIVFGEEAYEVCSPGELWLEALFHLGEEATSDAERWTKTYEDLKSERNESRLHDRALAQLMDFADEHNKRILLIVENLQELVGEQLSSQDGWVLRETLMNEPRLMLFGTATTRFDEIDNHNMAMYELFKIHDLKTLNVDDCSTFWQAITNEMIPAERMRPIQILTGGNPRLLAIIASFAAKASFRELMSDLTRMVDDHTDYFKSHLDCLPAQERKVFVALADLWDPATTSNVADACRLDVSKTSAYLKRLTDRGAVSIITERGGKRKYQVAERMYNIYHLMRRRGHPSSRVQAVVQFMVHFYEDEELIRRVQRLADEAVKLAPEHRTDYYNAYEGVLRYTMTTSLGDRILKVTPKEFLDCPGVPHSVRSILTSIMAPNQVQLGELGSAEGISTAESSLMLDELDKILQRDSLTEELLAFIRLFRKDAILDNNANSSITSYYSLRSTTAWLWLRKKIIECNLPAESVEESISTITKYEAQDPASCFVVAMLLQKNKNGEEAVAAYRKTLSIEPELAWAWIELGCLLYLELKRYDEAEQAYKKALELVPNLGTTWALLGMLLHYRLERHDEAEQAYKKALEFIPSNEITWAQLGALLHYKLERYYEAEQAYKKALELNTDYAWVWGKLGELLHQRLQRYDEAEQAYKKALELDPSITRTWTELGSLLHNELRRYDEAEQAFRQALELDPSNTWAWGELGALLYWKLERYDEAERTLKKALELDPSISWAWKVLINLLLSNNARYSEAIEMAEIYFQTTERSGESLSMIAWAVFKSGADDLSLAEAWANEAVQKLPQDGVSLHTLASIQGQRNKWSEALITSTLFLTDIKVVSTYTSDVVDFFVTATANGYAAESLRIIQDSPSATILEPLVVGLRSYIGEEVSVAQEIKEVAEDIVKRIQEQRSSIQTEK